MPHETQHRRANTKVIIQDCLKPFRIVRLWCQSSREEQLSVVWDRIPIPLTRHTETYGAPKVLGEAPFGVPVNINGLLTHSPRLPKERHKPMMEDIDKTRKSGVILPPLTVLRILRHPER